jgi:hypothetical protein
VSRGELSDCKVEITFQNNRLVSPSEAISIAASLRQQANLLGEPDPTPPQSTPPKPSPVPSVQHWKGAWKSEEKEVVGRLLKGIKHAGLRNWIAANIEFDRTSIPSSLPKTFPSDMIGVSPPSLDFKDRFFFAQITDGNGIQLAGNRLDKRRMNLLTFEAGKAFYGLMQSRKLPDGTTLAQWFARYEDTHRSAIEATKTIPYGDDSLENVYDPAIDRYSGFGYLFRMQSLDLGSPPDFQERVNWLLQTIR